MSKITQEKLFQYLEEHPEDDVDMYNLMEFANNKQFDNPSSDISTGYQF